jgi:hypothetical protein
MAEEYSFEVLDARRSVQVIQSDLRERIEKAIRGPQGNAETRSLPELRSARCENVRRASFGEIESRIQSIEKELFQRSADEAREKPEESIQLTDGILSTRNITSLS